MKLGNVLVGPVSNQGIERMFREDVTYSRKTLQMFSIFFPCGEAWVLHAGLIRGSCWKNVGQKDQTKNFSLG